MSSTNMQSMGALRWVAGWAGCCFARWARRDTSARAATTSFYSWKTVPRRHPGRASIRACLAPPSTCGSQPAGQANDTIMVSQLAAVVPRHHPQASREHSCAPPPPPPPPLLICLAGLANDMILVSQVVIASESRKMAGAPITGSGGSGGPSGGSAGARHPRPCLPTPGRMTPPPPPAAAGVMRAAGRAAGALVPSAAAQLPPPPLCPPPPPPRQPSAASPRRPACSWRAAWPSPSWWSWRCRGSC